MNVHLLKSSRDTLARDSLVQFISPIFTSTDNLQLVQPMTNLHLVMVIMS